MKKLFTVDDFIVGVIAALGYGLGFEIPKNLELEEWQCLLICLAVGMIFENFASKIVFSKVVQNKTQNKILVCAAFLLIFLLVEYVVVSWTELSMYEYLLEQYMYLIALPILGFAFSMSLRWYRVRKIRELYGDGSGGFVFDELLKRKKLLEKLNRQNQKIHGAFENDLAVKTKTGVFIGEKHKDSIIFCGIPYAKPPVDKLRWKAPEQLPTSEEVFEAKYLGASAIQVDYEGSPLKHFRQSEDCLYLNICVVSPKMKKKKPVIVIFHHGDFSYGGSADPILYGGELTKIYQNSVFVTFNYRLGILGFIDFSEVEGGENYPDALNLGLLDQIAALKWIKENISEFGGDAENITVMGFESGSLSIALLTTCERAKGLFQKAFIFNGSPMSSYETSEVSKKLAKKLLKATSTTTMQELLKIPTEKLKEVTQKLALDLSAPTRDEKFIPIDVFDFYASGAVSDVEFIIGISANERRIYKAYVGDEKYKDFMAKEIPYILNYLDENYPDETQNIKNFIEEQKSTMSEVDVNANIWEQCYSLTLYKSAKKLVDGGSKVHLLYWDVKPLIKNLGSGTVDVLASFLGNSESAQIYGNVLNQDIAITLQTLFRKFANGDRVQIFNNEIKGVAAIDWKEFPQALIVSEKAFRCESIAKKLSNIKGLLKIFTE